MKNALLMVLIVLGQSLLFGQVEQLRKAQDTRKRYINVESKGKRKSAPFLGVSPLQYVDPFIGTGGHGHTYPGASAPFGMMQLSPDTRHTGWDGCSGYHYSDSIIYGFSHTHLSGTGVSDYGDLLVVPQVGKPHTEPGYLNKNGYGASFSHDREWATPGEYKVELDGGKIRAHLVAMPRSGFHKYTFKDSLGRKFILLDLDHRDRVLKAGFTIHDKKTISGFRVSEAWATEQYFFFHMESDIPYQKARVFKRNGRNKLLLTYPRGTKQVQLKVGISAVDEAGAKKNLQREIPHWAILRTKVDVEKLWAKEFWRIDFESKNPDILTNFYTGLYHSFLAPNIFNDVDGRYRGRDKQVHQLTPDLESNYTVFSLWDTYRGTHPLFTITQRKRTKDFIKTFLRQFEQGGDLPVWELAGNETECMIGYHSVSVIADAYLKGIDGFDTQKAMEAMIATSNFDEFGKKPFAQNGFIGTGDEPESVSKTLEYAYDDFCISRFIQEVDTESDMAANYGLRSLNFINLYDPKTKFMRGRRSGMWFSPFDPAEVNFNYTEANSWQYSLYAPHAVGILRDLMGGKDSLENWLDRLFTTEMELSGRDQADITGLIGQYAHGNEPSHHMAYLYNYTNAPHKTQKYVHRILKEMYSPTPDGLSGNEDCGQMSSWYVLSALGFYPIAPGIPVYDIGRPLMDRAVIRLENGKDFEIVCENNSRESVYVDKIFLNGKKLDRNFLFHDDIMNGGKLVFKMSTIPSREVRKHAQTLKNLPAHFTPAPFFEQESRVFVDSMEISLGVVYPEKYTIHYTVDGTNPTHISPIFEKLFWIRENTTVKAIAINKASKRSSIIENSFVLKDENISLKLRSEYANQYAAGGPFTLIDGIQGNKEYRTGDWQGYWAQDIIAEVSFEEPRSLNNVGIGTLSDTKSWIFLPKEVIIEGSFDGKDFTKLGTIKNNRKVEENLPAHREVFQLKTNTTVPFKKIRVVVKNAGKCPEWHLGAGNDTWLFVDEILLD